jgi:hypothetical protein
VGRGVRDAFALHAGGVQLALEFAEGVVVGLAEDEVALGEAGLRLEGRAVVGLGGGGGTTVAVRWSRKVAFLRGALSGTTTML